MKTFKDLNVGNSVFVGFEKKSIEDIQIDSTIMDSITLKVNSGEYYTVTGGLSYDYCGGQAEFIFTGKEAIVSYYTKKLKDLRANFKICNSYYKQMLKIAKELE